MTLLESCPTFPVPDQWVDRPVAQLRFDPEEKTWELYCADRNGRWRWYIDALPTHDFDALLKEVDEDPTSIFWG